MGMRRHNPIAGAVVRSVVIAVVGLLALEACQNQGGGGGGGGSATGSLSQSSCTFQGWDIRGATGYFAFQANGIASLPLGASLFFSVEAPDFGTIPLTCSAWSRTGGGGCIRQQGQPESSSWTAADTFLIDVQQSSTTLQFVLTGHVRSARSVLASGSTGCGSDASDAGSTPDSGSGPTPLFEDDFSSFPGAAWLSIGDVSQDAGAGNPAPSVVLRTSGFRGSRLRYVGNPFATGLPLTISVDIAIDPATVQSGTEVFGALIAAELNGDPIYADVKMLVSKDGNGMTYGTGVYRGTPSSTETRQPFGPDPGFHRFQFRWESSGGVTWTRDGIAQRTEGGFPAVNLLMELYVGLSCLGGSSPCPPQPAPFAVRFDNVRVTRP